MEGEHPPSRSEQLDEKHKSREKILRDLAMDDEETTMPGNGSKASASSPRVKPFRFKDSAGDKHSSKSSGSSSHRHGRRSRRHHRRERSSSRHDSPRGDRRRRYSDDYRRHHKPRASRSRSRSPRPARELSPETAFRESLFDAMADDEGAAYWEGVYGQPIHNFGPMSPRSGEKYEGDDYNDPGVLDADAYAAYVRRKMWERSHQHVIEERKKREQEQIRREEQMKEEREAAARRKAREREARGDRDAWDEDFSWGGSGKNPAFDDAFARKIDQSLKRGQQRKEGKHWRQAWERYSTSWAKATVGGQLPASEIPWPVRSGRQEDVDSQAIRSFFDRAFPTAQEHNGSSPPVELRTQLKLERVRWHPDKVMQRFSTAENEETIKTVTAVFQTVDQMWNESKS